MTDSQAAAYREAIDAARSVRVAAALSWRVVRRAAALGWHTQGPEYHALIAAMEAARIAAHVANEAEETTKRLQKYLDGAAASNG